ncbi:AraC family transcriptional regulator [Flavobacterium sp. F372]|uniref:AraC family transcriptional regulator n=1 Tax=Flavobacterium bernardetii TaxID=2813823 RepID=A0ABR7IYZ2_9FLAO|nr:helix-turn-helix domain-containing protein [Flavobacterium bernardetii]MBC5834991.1 AraC family transcriptional regulator [Flavobacterium bernardetii]NHF70457.1 AraC family transcriptional regulator [Flavobacterium bernardetii]
MHKLFYFFILLVTAPRMFSQNLSELEIKKNRSIQELLISNPEKAYKGAIEISNSKNELFGFFGKYYVANYFYNKSEFTHSKQLLITLINRIEKSDNIKSSKVYQDLIGMCINKLFYIHKNLGEYDLALFYLDKYKKNVPNNHFNEQYGSIKVAMGDYVNGISLLKRELKTSHHLKLGIGEKKVMNKKLFADKYNIIGEAYQKYYIQTKKTILLDSANYYFNVAAKMMLQDNFYPEYTRALLSMREAKSAALAGNYVKSLSLYRERKKFPSIQENIRTEQLFDLGMADCFHHLNEVDSALFYCRKYIKNYQITKVSKENLLMAYNIMTQCYSEKKDNKNAYLYAQKSLELIQSIGGIKNKSLNFLHNYDLNKIKEESDKIIASKNYFKISLFGILIILSSVIYSFYYYHKVQKEKHYRFLKIIQNLKESKTSSNNNLEIDKTETQPKQIIDDELIEKIVLGLKKIEKKETFLDPNFKLAFVAKKLNTNTAYLSQYFNQVMQKTFSEYTQELRIQYVLQKLIDAPYFRKYTLQAIAEEVGYKDANTFVRVFKKQTGRSPNYYIEKLEN